MKWIEWKQLFNSRRTEPSAIRNARDTVIASSVARLIRESLSCLPGQVNMNPPPIDPCFLVSMATRDFQFVLYSLLFMEAVHGTFGFVRRGHVNKSKATAPVSLPIALHVLLSRSGFFPPFYGLSLGSPELQTHHVHNSTKVCESLTQAFIGGVPREVSGRKRVNLHSR